MSELYTLTTSTDLAESLEIKAAIGAANRYGAALAKAIDALPAEHREPLAQAVGNAIKTLVHAVDTAHAARSHVWAEKVGAAFEAYHKGVMAQLSRKAYAPTAPPLAGMPAVHFEAGAFQIQFPAGGLDVNLHRAEPQEVEIIRDEQGRVAGARST